MTPRQAAKSAKGREKLVAWLKLLERRSSALGVHPGAAFIAAN
jgi:hypothetical protein